MTTLRNALVALLHTKSQELQALGPIWNIFYIHCIDPETWPIFDQHTYRAMRFMKTGSLEEIPKAHRQVYEIYKRDFIPFVDALRPFAKSAGQPQRTIDKALFALDSF